MCYACTNYGHVIVNTSMEIMLFALLNVIKKLTASVVKWLEFLATDPEVPGSIPDPTRFS
jgi:hypothetical protein